MKHFLLLFITLICVHSALGIVAVSDTVYVDEDAPAFSGDLSLNDTIAEGITAWYNIISQTPEDFGSISLNSTGTFTFNLISNVHGEKKYLYSVCTAPGGSVCDLAELVIIVSSVNDAPSFQISARQVCQAVGFSGDVIAAATDQDGDAILLTQFSPAIGTATFQSNGFVNLVLPPDYVGDLVISYQLCDNGEPSACVDRTVTWSVRANAFTVTPAITYPTCVGRNDGAIVVQVTGGLARSLQWYKNGVSMNVNWPYSISNLGTALYELVVTDPQGCAESFSQTFDLAAPQVIGVAVEREGYDCELGTVAMRAIGSGGTGTLYYEWESGTNSAVELQPAGASLTVLVNDVAGCLNEVEVQFEAGNCDFSGFMIPQGFSPNNDFLNDRFVITDIESLGALRLLVWSAAGEVVYDDDFGADGWDGTHQTSGALVPPGTYYFELRALTNGLARTGFIVIRY